LPGGERQRQAERPRCAAAKTDVSDEFVLLSRVGSDYPGTWQEFDRWFVDDQACIEFLERVRRPGGFVCPVCGHARAWRIGGGLWMCNGCGRN
jgi:hypothetical protein